MQWLFDFWRVWCSRGVPDNIAIKPNTKLFFSRFTSAPPESIETGEPREISNAAKKKRRSHYTTVSRTSSRSELLTCEFRASRLICFSFYLQSEQDGIFGEGLFFLRLNNAWNNSSVSITPRQTHTHTHFEATAASCHGKRCWRRGFSTRDFKAVLLVVVVVLIRSQRLKQKKKLHTEMFKDGCCFLRFTRDWCRLGVTDSG